MKKIMAFAVCLVLLCTFTGCSGTNRKNDDKVTIVTTVFPMYDFARNVAGDKAEVILLLPAGADAHSYEPTVQDVVKIQDCDLFIYLGKDAEPWAESIISEKGNKGAVIAAMDYAELKKEEHSHDGHNGYKYDQHVWTSLKNSQSIVNGICETLKTADKENAAYYEKNAQAYSEKLNELDCKFEELAGNIEKTVVFADRFPFSYFAEDYGLRCFAAYPGCSDESEPSTSSVAKLIDTVREEQITTIFYTETSNGQLPDAVCEDTGAKKQLFHSCHTVTKEQMENNITYIELMERNYQALKELM